MLEKIVFFGSGPYVTPIIKRLKEDFDLLAVITTEKKPTDPVIAYCNENKIEFISVTSLKDFSKHQELTANCRLAVLASFGLIVPDSVINMFPLGIINIHPSLLPYFRGPTPVQSAILAGKTMTGVSIMKLDSEVDHGPLLGTIDSEIGPNDTAESLYKKLFTLGAEFLGALLPKYISGELKPFEQDHTKATFTDHLTRESGFIDLNKEPTTNPQVLNQMIRAYYPWPGVWFKVNLKLQTENSKLNGKIIKLLPDNRIQVEGKNAMKIKDFINGYHEGKEIVNKLGLNE